MTEEKKKRSIITDRQLKELETWLSTREAAQRMDVSRQGAIDLARDTRSSVRGVHVGKGPGAKDERGYWIFDPISVDESPEYERKRRKDRGDLITRVESGLG